MRKIGNGKPVYRCVRQRKFRFALVVVRNAGIFGRSQRAVIKIEFVRRLRRAVVFKLERIFDRTRITRIYDTTVSVVVAYGYVSQARADFYALLDKLLVYLVGAVNSQIIGIVFARGCFKFDFASYNRAAAHAVIRVINIGIGRSKMIYAVVLARNARTGRSQIIGQRQYSRFVILPRSALSGVSVRCGNSLIHDLDVNCFAVHAALAYVFTEFQNRT